MFYNSQTTTPLKLANLLNAESFNKNSLSPNTNLKTFQIGIVEKSLPYIIDNTLISSFEKSKGQTYSIQSSKI